MGTVYNQTHEEIFIGFGQAFIEACGEIAAQGDVFV